MTAFEIFAIGAAVLVVLWLFILWLERRAEGRQPDPHQEAHGDVIKPPSSWRER